MPGPHEYADDDFWEPADSDFALNHTDGDESRCSPADKAKPIALSAVNGDDDEFDCSCDEADLIALPAVNGDDDEFDCSCDEAELIALADAPITSSKRKADFDADYPASKRAAIEGSQYLSLATKVLTRDFGLKSFRLKQEQVISRILSGGSATVVFPTGGGKSLCYQVPALVFSEIDKLADTRGERDGGITIVVSPLIALMKDQVDALARRGIKAATFDSTKTREEYLAACRMLRNGELKLLYCAPEKLNNEGFVQQMRGVRGGIRLLAVDEAHCISEWGHAFRPDYLKISRFVAEIKAERVICLTATATPRVAEDICKAFDIDHSGLFRTSTYRKNLRLLAESGPTKQHLYPRLFSFLRAHPGSTIVYVTLQKQTEALADDLRDQGFNVKHFHAGMDAAVKANLQDEFMRCEDLIIVATIAFGMGIDKASIRNVIHFNIPSSLESYSQEIGRAGRDGMSSNCMFYICGEDLHLREMFARGDLVSRESIHGLLKDIFDPTPVDGELKTSHYAQEREFDIRATTMKNIYAQLELSHGLFRATTPIYTKYSFKPSSSYLARLESDNSLAARAIKQHSYKLKLLYHIDVNAAAAQIGIPRVDIIRKLSDWNESEILELKPSGTINVYKVLKPLPKATADIEKIVSDIYSHLEKSEQKALDRTNQMLHLITSEACFSRSLAQHFGDELPSGRKECGHCTWCLTHRAVVQRLPTPMPFNFIAFKAVLDHVKERDDARFLARVAFGITSPRVTAMKLGKHRVFASMADHDFMSLLRAFTTTCSKANQARYQ